MCIRDRFYTLIDQIGRVPLFGAGTTRYIRSQPIRLAVTALWRAPTASWRQKGKRKQIFPRAIRTTELPSNPSPLTFRNNQVQILQTSSTHATMAANVSHQTAVKHVPSAAAVVRHLSRRPYDKASGDCQGFVPLSRVVCACVRVTTTCSVSIINTSYQNLVFGSGDDPDKFFFHQTLN